MILVKFEPLGMLWVPSYDHWCALWYGIMQFYDPPQNPQTLANLIKFGALWVCQHLWGHGGMSLVKVGPLGMLWVPSYDHLCALCYGIMHFYDPLQTLKHLLI